MKRISLLRHAEAAERSPAITDRERPLTKKGREDSRLMGGFLAKSDRLPGLALCSPSTRTRETLDGVNARLAEPLETMIDAAIYEATEEEILEAIKTLPDECDHVLVVGHNPGFHALGVRLADPHESDARELARIANKFPKGALAVFEFDIGAWRKADFGGGRLVQFTRPKDLRK
ncbi:SixA phosphatase family protein [Hyphococcus luteus]|uniref:Phosphohistidine phosphatase n=1 Tax=Hyphococcus luteus TaxID=2058213 RepID=A0A2S7K9E9_9PROT|nr:histidine phosphatase family protein [Marinicaulis flavus]PQA89101.1 hypothetical protein CW354_03910 [Marinicaulis flavus]